MNNENASTFTNHNFSITHSVVRCPVLFIVFYDYIVTEKCVCLRAPLLASLHRPKNVYDTALFVYGFVCLSLSVSLLSLSFSLFVVSSR